MDIPTAWAGRRVDFLWDAYAEGCVWQNGEPLQGLTGSESAYSSPVCTERVYALRPTPGGEHIELFVELACNGMFGTEGGVQSGPHR